MTNITMAVEPMVIVKTDNDFSLTVEDVFFNPDKLQELHRDNWSVEIFWFPFNSLSWLCLTCIGLVKAIEGGLTYGIITEVYSSRRRIPEYEMFPLVMIVVITIAGNNGSDWVGFHVIVAIATKREMRSTREKGCLGFVR